MTVQHRLEFVYGQVAWMTSLTVVLVVVNALSYELFFAGSFIGLLVMVEYTSPKEVAPTWRRRLRWLIVIGLLVFAALVAYRTIRALPTGVI